MLDWVLNTSLLLSSNVIWHAYRLTAETNFRAWWISHMTLSVKEEKTGKKV